MGRGCRLPFYCAQIHLDLSSTLSPSFLHIRNLSDSTVSSDFPHLEWPELFDGAGKTSSAPKRTRLDRFLLLIGQYALCGRFNDPHTHRLPLIKSLSCIHSSLASSTMLSEETQTTGLMSLSLSLDPDSVTSLCSEPGTSTLLFLFRGQSLCVGQLWVVDPHLHLCFTPILAPYWLHHRSCRYLCHVLWTTPCNAGSQRLSPSSIEFYVFLLLLSLPSLVQPFSSYSMPQAVPAGLQKLAVQDAGIALEPSDRMGRACCTCRSCWTAVGPGWLWSHNEAVPGECALVWI